ncbi:MAG: hypothetical protein AAGB48_01230 [Planctomycetota bacterium]
MLVVDQRSCVLIGEGPVERVQRDHESLAVLMSLIESNTRALAALEAGQSRLVAAIERMQAVEDVGRGPAGARGSG